MISSACIQNTHDLEPTWLEGSVSISRSPVAHPGDGKPTVLSVFDMIVDTFANSSARSCHRQTTCWHALLV